MPSGVTDARVNRSPAIDFTGYRQISDIFMALKIRGHTFANMNPAFYSKSAYSNPLITDLFHSNFMTPL